jgi:hypothetical protein
MWVRLRERLAPARRPEPVQALRREPPPALLGKTNLQAQAQVFAHQR